MSEILYREKRFWYLDGQREQVLIDLRRCMDNRSRIPIINTEQNPQSVMRLVMKLHELHGELKLGDDVSFDYMLLDFLTARCLMKTSMPLKVVEIGAMTGVWSFHLAAMMGQYNRDSTLCCVCNAVGNESGNRWVDRIALVAEPPRLSMVAADYDDTMLQSGGFDLVLLNGSVLLENPYRVIKEAERLVKTGGVILCYVRKQTPFAEMFARVFSDFETFVIHPGTQVSYMEYRGQSWEDPGQVSCRDEAEKYLSELPEDGLAGMGRTELRDCYRKLEEYIMAAMQERQTDLKVRLIRRQEAVLDAMYP